MPTSGCKVDRIAKKYGLQRLDERLLRRRKEDEMGLRSLESWINPWVLQRAMQRAGMTTVDGEAENYHRLLCDENVIETARTDARRELASAGVEVDTVEEDFVSYQTIKKHLNECLDTDTSRSYEPDLESDIDTFEQIFSRVDNVVSKTINRLRRYGELSLGEPEVLISVKVRCGDCGRTHDVISLMRERECPCSSETVADDEQEVTV